MLNVQSIVWIVARTFEVLPCVDSERLVPHTVDPIYNAVSMPQQALHVVIVISNCVTSFLPAHDDQHHCQPSPLQTLL